MEERKYKEMAQSTENSVKASELCWVVVVFLVVVFFLSGASLGFHGSQTAIGFFSLSFQDIHTGGLQALFLECQVCDMKLPSLHPLQIRDLLLS